MYPAEGIAVLWKRGRMSGRRKSFVLCLTRNGAAFNALDFYVFFRGVVSDAQFPSYSAEKGRRKTLFYCRDSSECVAGSKIGWELPLEGAFECGIREGIGILEGISG